VLETTKAVRESHGPRGTPMSRYAESSDATIRQRSGWLIPLGVFLVTFAVSALFLLFYLAPAPPSLFKEQVSFTSRADIVELRVHGHKFEIPANYLKYRSDRQGGERKEIKLIAILPDMEGYSGWEDAAFRSIAVDSPAVEMLIHDDPVKLSESAWLERIYMPYVVDPTGSRGPFGLTQFTFREESGYRNEDLFVGQTDRGPVVLQCVRFSQEVPNPSCHREMPIAHGVALSYRFKRAHLARWQEIADSTERLVQSFKMQPPG
jgi:hypothetical protein